MIVEAHGHLESMRACVAKAELNLQQQVEQFISSSDSSLRDLAVGMGVSVAYLSDIRHGRRKVSDAIVEKIRRLK